MNQNRGNEQVSKPGIAFEVQSYVQSIMHGPIAVVPILLQKLSIQAYLNRLGYDNSWFQAKALLYRGLTSPLLPPVITSATV